jgi:hypothetical protein
LPTVQTRIKAWKDKPMPQQKPTPFFTASILVPLILSVGAGWAAGRFGDMPDGWAQVARVYHGNGGNADELMEVVGCVLEKPIGGGKSMQCAETFLYLGPQASVGLALGNIANVQVEGRAKEARAYTATVGTMGDGAVDRAVVLHLDCYGDDIGECIGLEAPAVAFSNGWTFRAAGGSLELIGPDGTLRDVWN